MPSMSALPSLEQLKRQAKELLRAVRSGDLRALSRMNAHLPADHLPPLGQYSKVRLAQALFVIAREHGFASWPRLKASMSTTRTQTALEQPGKMTGGGVHALPPSGQRGVTSGTLVLTELAIELADVVIDRALADPSINVRRHATVALGSFCHDVHVLQVLQTLAAQEHDPAILREARQALRRL